MAPADLGDAIDWLFREAISDLASQAVASRSAAYERQRAPYAGRGFRNRAKTLNLPGIIRDMLSPWMDRPPPDDELRKLTRRIHAHLNQENKRRNLVGEGFEDVIAAVVSRLPGAEHLRSATAPCCMTCRVPPAGTEREDQESRSGHSPSPAPVSPWQTVQRLA